MLEQPVEFQELLENKGYMDSIYEALQQDDKSEIVVTYMDILTKTGLMPTYSKETKSETTSNMHRSQGNQAYSEKRFRSALESYNTALLYAPENSNAMKLAFSNRSALYITIGAYSACLKDIDTVFSMGCTDYKLVECLKQRKQDSVKKHYTESFYISNITGNYPKNFFKFNVKRHPQIPCASVDIDVITESGLPKIVAARDIPVGTVVAVEQPFVSDLDQDNCYVSCHYCHKLELNLIPCRNCCNALFCNEECMSKCNEEYHNIECKIISCLKEMGKGPAFRMKVRAALKIKQMCKSWKEFITASYNMGDHRMRNASVSDIYDVNSKFSLLSFQRINHFLYGEMYNAGLNCAVEIHHLGRLPSFLPKQEDERKVAIRALARIMMNLYLSYVKVEIINAATDICNKTMTSNTDSNYGWYAFTSKLKHSCDANLLVMGLKNNVALITTRPVKKGSELNISYLGHYYENIHPKRQYRLFCLSEQICSCPVCLNGWSSKNLVYKKLTAKETKAYRKWNSCVNSIILMDRDKKVFEATCEALTALESVQNTNIHHDLYRGFRTFIALAQTVATDNDIVHKDDEEFEIVIRS